MMMLLLSLVLFKTIWYLTISVVCKLSFEKPKNIPKYRKIQRFRRINADLFRQDLAASLACCEIQDTGLMTKQFMDALTRTTENYAPVVTMKDKGQTSKQWYTDKIHNARLLRRSLECKWRKSGLQIHKEMFLSQRKLVVHMIQDAKSEFYKSALLSDRKDMFKSLLGRKHYQLPNCNS